MNNAWFYSKDDTARIKLSDRVMDRNAKAWLPLKDELMPGMKAPKSAFIEVTAADVIHRNKQI